MIRYLKCWKEERLREYVEALDVLKIKNSMQPQPKQQAQSQYKEQDLVTIEEEASRKRTASLSGLPVIITTAWETFDSNPTAAAGADSVKPVHPETKWESFD